MKPFENEIAIFPTSHNDILQRIQNIDPVSYGHTRNFVNGDVTYLSPYISRGVISTKQVLDAVLNRGFNPDEIEKFIQELAWRDYWQNIWIAKGEAINKNLKSPQKSVAHTKIPTALVNAKTNIEAIDTAITNFYKTGYIHNHVRMYLAAIACNVGQSHWNYPAKWMYYHLLDADWASNALSWQWVAGTNSTKKYIANQANINKYCFTEQKDTFLDIPYKNFKDMPIPDELIDITTVNLETPLPKWSELEIHPALPTCIYNWYNLDPNWKTEISCNRVLLLEPSIFNKYPISQKSIDFMLDLSKNISGIQIYVGEFESLVSNYKLKTIYYKEHPLNEAYSGNKEPRDWMFNVKGYLPSFFKF